MHVFSAVNSLDEVRGSLSSWRLKHLSELHGAASAQLIETIDHHEDQVQNP